MHMPDWAENAVAAGGGLGVAIYVIRWAFGFIEKQMDTMFQKLDALAAGLSKNTEAVNRLIDKAGP